MRDVAVKANMNFDTFEQAHLNKYVNKIDISIYIYAYGIHHIILYESYLMGNNSIFVSKQYTFLYNNGQVC